MVSIYGDTIILIYSACICFILGAVMGSFLNCAAYRTAHGQSFIKGRSHCTSCGHELSVKDLFPIFSYLFLRGKCRYCGAKVSVRYPLTELFFALLTVGCLLRFDLTLLCLRNYIFICCLFYLTLTDIESCIIPDGALIISVVAWAFYLPFSGQSWVDMLLSIAAALVYGGAILLISIILDKVLKKESMGGGDIKLFAVCGLYFGFVGTLFAVIIACVVGLITAPVMKRIRGEKHFPFGPSIAFSSCLMLFIGQTFVSWYMGLLS